MGGRWGGRNDRGLTVGESVPVRCPECLHTQAYAAPVFPCACGSPVAPPVKAGATAERITHRNWTDAWVTVRCEACGREDDWPHPELGCSCGTVLRVPVRPVPPVRPVEPGASGGTDEAEVDGSDPGAVGDVADVGGPVSTGSAPAWPQGPRTVDRGSEWFGAGPAGGRGAGTGTGGQGAAGVRASDTGTPYGGPDTSAPGTGSGTGGPDSGRSGPGPQPEPEDPPRATASPTPPPPHGPQGPHAPLTPPRSRPFAERYPVHIPLPPTGPRPAPARGTFQPLTIRTARDAVAAAAEYLRWLGFRDVVQPEERPASGVDLRAPGLVAQVDPSTRPTGLRAVECLWLNGLSTSAVSVCFSLAGYTPEARSRAAEIGLPLFVLDLTGTPQPVNDAADGLATGA